VLTTSEYLELDALDLSRGLRNKDFSCCEVMHAAIDRASVVNPTLNAVLSPNYDQAMSQAQAFDQNPEIYQQSLLAGLPFLIKDLATVKGLVTGFGSRLYNGVVSQQNAKIVHRYIDAGLIVIGKTNTPEFGLTLTTEPVANGATKNPWNLGFSTGGSSGGAAAAVASGILPVAHATDGGGSIRIPAANCGLVGFKPSRGLTTIEDEIAGCWSGMSVGHVVSQTVRDSAAFLDVITLSKPHLFPKPHSPAAFLDELNIEPRPLTVGIQLTPPMGQQIHSDCIGGVQKAAKYLSDLGHSVTEINHPVDYKHVTSATGKIINIHVYQSVKKRLSELGLTIESSQLESSSKLMATIGSKISADDYITALDTLKRAAALMHEFHKTCDIIISPVLSMPPAPLGWLDMNSDDLAEYGDKYKHYSGFSALYNATGQPSLSLPLHQNSQGLPIGVMLTANWGEDALLLQLARQLETAYPWPRRAPL
jgi:amidase